MHASTRAFSTLTYANTSLSCLVSYIARLPTVWAQLPYAAMATLRHARQPKCFPMMVGGASDMFRNPLPPTHMTSHAVLHYCCLIGVALLPCRKRRQVVEPTGPSPRRREDWRLRDGNCVAGHSINSIRPYHSHKHPELDLVGGGVMFVVLNNRHQ